MSTIKLARSIEIEAAPSVVFDLVSRVDRLPRWYGKPLRFPSALQIARLSLWGDHVPGGRSAAIFERNSRDQIHIRSLPEKEFRFLHSLRSTMSYECIFHITPWRGGCRLTCEIHYTSDRIVDRFRGPGLSSEGTCRTVEESLEIIGRLAEVISRQRASLPSDAEALIHSWNSPKHKAS